MGNDKIDHKFWMNQVRAYAHASTCRVKIGCVLVQNKKPVGFGFVGSVSGDYHCCDKTCLLVDNFGVKGSSNTGKSCIKTIHAEMNAVLHCNVRGDGSGHSPYITCYSTYSPCLECFKSLLQIGVRTFIYEKDYKDLNRDTFLKHLAFAPLLTFKKIELGE